MTPIRFMGTPGASRQLPSNCRRLRILHGQSLYHGSTLSDFLTVCRASTLGTIPSWFNNVKFVGKVSPKSLHLQERGATQMFCLEHDYPHTGVGLQSGALIREPLSKKCLSKFEI